MPYPPGGSTDMLARIVGQKLGERLRQPVVVENKAGAGGNVGTDYVAKQPADGYTIVMGNIGPIAINPSLYPDLPYSPLRDLAPVTMLMAVPNLLVVNPALPVHSVQELVDYGKRQPAPLSYATPGAGTSLHLAGELFATTAGLRLTHVPYKGSAPGLNDTMAGHVPLMFDNMPSALPLVKAGKLRALAITSAQRSPQLPDVPTMAEAGLRGYEIAGWFGVLVPAATPRPIVARLDAELQAVLNLPDVRRKLEEMGGIVSGAGPQPFGRYIEAEARKWGTLVHSANITIQ
ncbi:Bug family tripartite tricarboxylate transporter substrate binding protein [Cupriavidus sp. 30B13]|uniref:Bug family tripartite tricarboxylate transporter substrate binding protein n=1 Tax=Cupriavidus sp. 30B13 TaxID=3384241 RepID=UPI003B982E91